MSRLRALLRIGAGAGGGGGGGGGCGSESLSVGEAERFSGDGEGALEGGGNPWNRSSAINSRGRRKRRMKSLALSFGLSIGLKRFFYFAPYNLLYNNT